MYEWLRNEKKVHDVRGSSGSDAQDREFFTLVCEVRKASSEVRKELSLPFYRWRYANSLLQG